MTRCKICASPQRDALEAALASGASIRSVAGRFSVSRDLISGHRTHPPASALPRSHVELVLADISAVRARLGDAFGARQEAEAGLLLTLAEAVDGNPTSPGLLRELRAAEREFHEAYTETDSSASDPVAEFLSALRINVVTQRRTTR